MRYRVERAITADGDQYAILALSLLGVVLRRGPQPAWIGKDVDLEFAFRVAQRAFDDFTHLTCILMTGAGIEYDEKRRVVGYRPHSMRINHALDRSKKSGK